MSQNFEKKRGGFPSVFLYIASFFLLLIAGFFLWLLGGWWFVFEVIAWILISGGVISVGLYFLPIGIQRLGKKKIFFSQIATNSIEYIKQGETIVGMVLNAPGNKLQIHELDDDGNIIRELPITEWTIVPGEEAQSWLRKKTGCYWVGPYPIRRVERKIPISKKRLVNGRVETIEELVYVDHLRVKDLYRVIEMKEIECKDGVQVRCTITVGMNLYIPYIPVGNVQSDFYEIVDEFIKKFIAFLCGQVTSQEFVTMDYVIQTTINKYDILNGEGLGLVEKLGMSVTRVIITNPDLMDRRVQKAMEEEKIAIAQGQAVKAKASADGNALKIKADAEAEARKIRAHAEAIALELVNKQEYGDVMALVQKLIDSDPRIDPNLAAQIAGTIGKTKRLPPGITTLVEKGEVGVMINPSTPPNTANDKKKGSAQ